MLLWDAAAPESPDVGDAALQRWIDTEPDPTLGHVQVEITAQDGIVALRFHLVDSVADATSVGDHPLIWLGGFAAVRPRGGVERLGAAAVTACGDLQMILASLSSVVGYLAGADVLELVQLE